MTAATEPDDLSPMLSQPASNDAESDLAPMIGGRGAKIAVEARGAYVAGNLRALIEFLDDPKRDRLHVRLVQQAVGYARHALPTHVSQPAALPILDASVHALEIADQWRIDRDPQAAYKMIDILTEVQIVSMTNCVSSYGMMFAFLSCALLTSSIEDISFWIERSIACGLNHRRKLRQLSEEEYRLARQAATQWQVETTWAILQGYALPPLEV